MPNIAKRWTEIKIPIYKDEDKFNEVKNIAKNVVEQQWNALKEIDNLKKNFNVYNT